MRKIIILTAFIFSTAVFSNIHGQQEAPAGGGDKNLRDDGVKIRSVELERVKRETKKKSQTGNNPVAGRETEDQLEARFDQIKTDYEQVQLSQDMVVKAYQSGSKIDYAQIGKSAAEINTGAKRLKKNLFTALEKSDSEKEMTEKKDVETEKSRSVRSLIVDLDNAIGSFAMSPMFKDLRVIDPVISEKAKSDLQKIIDLSAELNAEAEKMAESEK